MRKLLLILTLVQFVHIRRTSSYWTVSICFATMPRTETCTPTIWSLWRDANELKMHEMIKYAHTNNGLFHHVMVILVNSA